MATIYDGDDEMTDEDAEAQAVMQTYSEGYDDGWYGRPRRLCPYDSEAYNRGHDAGLAHRWAARNV